VAARVLVVEDDADIWRTLEILLGRAGHEPLWAADGAEGLRLLESAHPDLVVLDIGLPRVDGWEVLERIRRRGDAPVIVLTARGLESDKLRGLRGGADDYVTKPFGNAELMARIDALLRRSGALDLAAGSIFDDGWLQVDLARHTVVAAGTALTLTPAEFRLLAVLVRHSGAVVTSSQLLEQAWHDPTTTGHAKVRSTVGVLRQKLSRLSDRNPIETVRGFGYRYHPAGLETAPGT
jgi:DNA-binding response OmpR family regulator